MKLKRNSILLVIILALVFGSMGILKSLSESFYSAPSVELITFSFIDLFFSILVGSIVLFSNKNLIKRMAENFHHDFNCFLKNSKLLLFSILVFTLFLATQSIHAILSEGAVRQVLLRDLEAAGFGYLFVSAFWKVMLPSIVFFSDRKSYWVIGFLGIGLTLFITGSRSELVYSAYILLTLSMINFGKKIIYLGLITGLVVFVMAVFITIFVQGRPISNSVYGFIELIEKHFLYKAYSVHIAQKVLEIGSYEKVIFPFLGYPSEWLLQKVFILENPVDSNFVTKYQVIGADPETGAQFLVNVVYPWWSWFVGAFGAFGLIIKALFQFVVLNLLLTFRLFFSFFFFLSYTLFIASSGTIHLTLSSVFTLVIVLIFDILVFNYRGKYERCNTRKSKLG